MSAVVRVKRRLTEEPHEALILACKRKRLSVEPNEDSESVKTVLQFACTVQSQADDVILHITKHKINPRDSFKHKIDLNKKLKEERTSISKENRFKVVNCFRSGNKNTFEEEKSSNVENGVTVVDIITDINESLKFTDAVPNNKVEEEKYVYDLYYSTQGDINVDPEDVIEIEQMHSEWVLQHTDPLSESEEECDDDSNDENNWRNDYPDSDHSINEDDMRLAAAVDDIDLDDGLSSDDPDVYDDDNTDYCKFSSRYQRKIRMCHLLDDGTDENENSDDELEDDAYFEAEIS